MRLRLSVAALFLSGCVLRGLADGPRLDDGGVPHLADGGSSSDGADDACGAGCGERALTILAKGQPAVLGLATNGKLVVWSVVRSVRACAVEGCSAPSDLRSDLDITGELALEGDLLSYTTGATSSHGVARCTVPGCKDDVGLGYDLGAPWSLAVDQRELFTLERQGRRVLRCGSPPCGDAWDVIASNVEATGAVAVSVARVYWSSLPPEGSIYVCPRSGCASAKATVLAMGQGNPRALTVDATNVYWSDFDGGTISSCPLDGCVGAPRVVATGQGSPFGVASDGAHVYWANASSGTLSSCEVSGCIAPRVLASGLDRPQRVALDAAAVYVATASGIIAKVAK